ncbi:amidohydrolase family protein [Polymorphobacter sp. PAMC 29334]|uniref:metal-dependent hydrolase family protein n=1 Tax=Polymorphobacter sp. PAMC 29334 TaxID=2862331 RepID=UPI001C66914C|nr:amidohydrolase family protein [Polymorphobacter sp. PAMC 29334]QYE35197.1 amidohydrolase family protein [Polymorphobacter sp. PAMC 29334]
MYRVIAATMLLAAPAGAETIVIHAGRVVTDAALPARGPSSIVVTDGRIVSIGAADMAVPAGARVVDLSTKTVMPGLIDAHVHLTQDSGLPWYATLRPKFSEPYAAATGLKNALITARAGFTTVRDAGGPILASLAMRDAVAEGSFPGPRILVAGTPLSISGGHADAVVGLAPELAEAINAAGQNPGVCDSPEACAVDVRKIAAKGVDVIKFMATGGVLDDGAIGLEQHFSDAEMKAIVTTAHGVGLKAMAHAHGARGIEAAVEAGVDSIEHGTYLDEKDAKLMKARGTYMVATLMAFEGLKLHIGKGFYTPNVEAKALETLKIVGRGLSIANKYGVNIALGTDAAVFPHGRNAEELNLMVTEGGMTPKAALIAATMGGARLLGVDKVTGTLEPGKFADLIAIDGDPQTDPKAVLSVSYVMTQGRTIPMK